MATDTIHAKKKSIHRELYCQVFDTKEFLVEAYLIQKKSDLSKGIRSIHQRLWSTRDPDLQRRQGTSGTEDRIPS